MIRNALAEPHVNALIRRLLIGWTVFGALLLAGLGGRGLYYHAQSGSALEAVQADKAGIEEAMATLDKSRAVKAVGAEEGLAAVNAFQRFFVDCATASGCTVHEVMASSESQPYVTKFEKDTPANEYVQLGFKSVVVGSPAKVVGALKGLADSPIPFEFDSAVLRRSSVKDGTSVVELAVELRVLAKGGGA